eukprot:CAMPEP_0114302916 /NCGR_PEP_ID=MMETSP0059-20121206/14925_1 /TAXON_ID=36894 /ORGANISM="Pyramimonas parkeae, Strain CCMP726" /LENGTH=78 /DNA_ID=CAMNT_0001425813 /DNA_START=640 /DNA_END=876 /DNA_ORIENTATION=-
MLKLAVGEQLVAVGQLVVGEQLVAGGQLVVGAASMEEDQAAAVTTMVALFDWRLGCTADSDCSGGNGSTPCGVAVTAG